MKVDNNTSEGQKILGRFVSNNIILCQSSLVDDLLSKGIYQYDDIENMYSINEDELTTALEEEYNKLSLKEQKEVVKWMKDNTDCEGAGNIYKLTVDEMTKMIEDLRLNIEPRDYDEPCEIFEWWTVSNRLLEKLAEKGQPILRTEHGVYWGRMTTGQAILLDSIIQRIYNETASEIMEGK